ncbi:MAG: VOC family protein [Bacteroidota bacterium]
MFLLWVAAILFGFGFGSKSVLSQETVIDNAFKEQTSALRLDHFFLWVKDPTAAVKRLESIGFTAIPDSLSAIHQGQGTAGRYFYFLNTYFELLFVHDREALIANDQKYGFLETQKRVDYENTKASAFGIGLQMEKYDPGRIPFEVSRFYQTYLPDNSYLYFASSSEQMIREPLTFVVCPELQSTVKDSETLSKMSENIRGFYEHGNKALRVSRIVVNIDHKGPFSKTMEKVDKVDNIHIKKGKEQLLEIFFDNQVQGKSHDLRPELPVIIYL